LWIDPEDPDYHRLFAVGAHDNIAKAQLAADPHSLTRAVLRYAISSIRAALSSFADRGTQNYLGNSIAASINEVYQKENARPKAERPQKRHPTAWISSKIFLDHSLLEILIKVSEARFGSHFTITQGSLEQLFNKTEFLPVSPFCGPILTNC
jgi:hypothetical protein